MGIFQCYHGPHTSVDRARSMLEAVVFVKCNIEMKRRNGQSTGYYI